MKKLLAFIAVLVMVLGFQTASYAFFIDFETGHGFDGTDIDDIPGVSFLTAGGSDWIYGDSSTGSYNTRSIDLGHSYGTANYQHYGNVFAWLGVSTGAGKIDFTNNDGTWFRTGYTAATGFTLDGYNSSDVLIATLSGPANTSQADMGWLQINAPIGETFDYILVHDSGNLFLLDNMSGDTTGIPGGEIPEPMSMALFGIGLLGTGYLRRRK